MVPEFPFPSNGNAYHKSKNGNTIPKIKPVSIPFKRESGSKVHTTWFVLGKSWNVSIPFKRESLSKGNETGTQTRRSYWLFLFPSNGKVYPKSVCRRSWNSRIKFPFPSNGKAYPKHNVAYVVLSPGQMFPFPSNGKAYHKDSRAPTQLGKDRVSIPFKRERGSKGLFRDGGWSRFR